jgi:sporulation protein YabP
MDMADESMVLPHKLTLNERKKLTMTGVTEVVSFEEDAVILKTTLGTLMIQGRQLQLKTLSLEGGQVEVQGTVCALSYEEPQSGGGFLRRLIG